MKRANKNHFICSVNVLIASCFFMIFVCGSFKLNAAPENTFVVPLCRAFSKDIFDLNAQPYLSPTVKVMNSVTNAGFFRSAYVPRRVNKPYFRLAVNGMFGTVGEDMRSFTPKFPMRKYDLETALGYVASADTVGLLSYFLQTLLYQGIVEEKTIQTPETASTTLGKGNTYLHLPHDVMVNLVKKHPAMAILTAASPETAKMIEEAVATLPEEFVLYEGGDITRVIAGVPQLEVGSLWGTELLVRFIPPIDFGEYIGKFYFWGLGIKHSISQYFYTNNYTNTTTTTTATTTNNSENNNSFDPNAASRTNIAPFDLAVQLVYQNTSLKNTVGATSAKLTADANIFNININASKNFDNMFEIYTGVSYELLDVKGAYKYTLPQAMQVSLGLLKPDPNDPNGAIKEPPEFPGDEFPQTSEVNVKESHVKFTFGAAKNLGPVTMYVDYSLSKYNILSGGVMYRF